MKTVDTVIEVVDVELDRIRPNDYNVNRMSEDDFEGLKEGIKISRGERLKDLPLLIRPLKDETFDFEIIDGEHRFGAVTELKDELGFTTIPCVIKEYSRREAQAINVTASKSRGNTDYKPLSKVFYEHRKKIKESGKNPKYDWEEQRLKRRLNAPGTMTQEEIGAWFGGYTKSEVSRILNIHINLEEELKEKLRMCNFSNRDKVDIARVYHPRFQEGLVENCFNEKGERAWGSKKLSKMATFYNKSWSEIEEKIDSIEDQNEVIEWTIKSKTNHKKDVATKINMVLARLKGPEYTDEELSLEDFKPETTTRWDIGARAKWGPHALYSENKYHGSYPPQLARNLIWKYSQPSRGEIVLDPFVGSGTTIMEAKILGQRGIGIDISEEVVELASEMCKFRLKDRVYYESELIVGDATKLTEIEDAEGNKVLLPSSVDLIVTHPPYWNMVIFSEKGIENLPFEGFLEAMKACFEQMFVVLKPEHFCCVVIGDVYREEGVVTTLIDEFLIMAKAIGFKVHDFAVKFSEGQESMGALMEWRAEEYNFLVPKHDFVLIFKKA